MGLFSGGNSTTVKNDTYQTQTEVADSYNNSSKMFGGGGSDFSGAGSVTIHSTDSNAIGALGDVVTRLNGLVDPAFKSATALGKAADSLGADAFDAATKISSASEGLTRLFVGNSADQASQTQSNALALSKLFAGSASHIADSAIGMAGDQMDFARRVSADAITATGSAKSI